MGSDKGPVVIGPQPGQAVIKREDYASEVTTPWHQIYRLALCNFIIYLALTAIGIIVLRLAGEWLVSAVVLVGGGWVLLRLGRRTNSWMIAGLLAAIFATLAVAILPQIMRLHLWKFLAAHALEIAMVWAIGFLLIVIIYPFLVGTYRYTGEVIDPSGPSAPRTAIAWPGVVWPWQVSKIFNVLNPAKAEKPEPVTERVQVEMTRWSENGQVAARDVATLLEGPNAIARSRQLAKWILGGAAISERGLSGQGRPLAGREEYQSFVDVMLERGLVAWNNPAEHRQGITLTVVGRKMLENLVHNGNGATPPHSEGA